MVVPRSDANQGAAASLLLFTLGIYLAACVMGFLLWLGLVILPLETTRASIGTDRFLLLLFVIAIQVSCLLLSSRRRNGKPARNEIVKALLIGVLCMLAAVILGILYDIALRVMVGAETPTIGPWGEVRRLDRLPCAAILIFGVLIGPAADERFFRGVLFGTWQAAGRPWSGALLSSALFALARLDPWNLLAYFGLGLLLCCVYRWTRSLLAVWIAHSLLNAALFVLLFCGYE
jgi:membrane protease YdiL (CAAX protease family)